MNRHWKLILIILLTCYVSLFSQNISDQSEPYSRVQQQLATGWNTWNTCSLLSHVLLPQGVGINLEFKETTRDAEYILEDPLTGIPNKDYVIQPGIRTWKSDYTELVITWHNMQIMVQSAVDQGNLYLLITPEQKSSNPVYVTANAGMIWNRPGSAVYKNNNIDIVLADTLISFFPSNTPSPDYNTSSLTPRFTLSLENSVGFCTGSFKNVEQIESIIYQKKNEYIAATQKYNDQAKAFSLMQSVTAWNTIYDPHNNRVLTTPDRYRNVMSGGWALKCGESFYAANMAAVDNKELAYANIKEILNTKKEKGLIPQETHANGFTTLDRSFLPLASMTLLKIYSKYKDKWLLAESFETLMSWNRWWDIYRNFDGLLCPGSNNYTDKWQTTTKANTLAAVQETGMPDSPMYLEVPYNLQTEILELWDVGLNSLYIRDCFALAEIATILGKTSEARELQARGDLYSSNLERLWDGDKKLYMNANTETEKKYTNLSATTLYPLITGKAPKEHAQTLVSGQLDSSSHYGGDHILPTIARNENMYSPNLPDKGAVSPQVNYLIYLSLETAGMKEAGAKVAAKSEKLLLNNWDESQSVYKYYSSENGKGIENQGHYDLLGGLLGLIALMQAGHF